MDSHSVGVDGAVVDLLQQLRGVQAPEAPLSDHEHLPDDRRRVVHLLEPFRRLPTIGPRVQFIYAMDILLSPAPASRAGISSGSGRSRLTLPCISTVRSFSGAEDKP